MGLHHDPVEAFRAQARASGWPTICDPTLGFERPELALFVATWRTKAAGRDMPARSDMTPRDLKQFLRKIVLFEQFDGPRYRVRLMGTALTQIWGDMTGRFVDEGIPPHLLPRWNWHVGTVIEAGRPIRFMTRIDFQDKNFLVAEMASVPLSDAQGRTSMVMSTIHASSGRSWEETAAALNTAPAA